MSSTSLEEIATYTGAELVGDGTLVVNSVAPLSSAKQGEITFINSSKFLSELENCGASAIIASPKMNIEDFNGTVLLHNNPYLAYAKTVQLMYPETRLSSGIHASAVVAEGVEFGENVSVGANAVIDADVKLGNRVQIGAGCVIGAGSVIADDVCLKANVTIYEAVIIGERSRIHSGTVIGADGFGYAPDAGVWHKIPQVGSVRIGSDVEIGANTTIDRGAISDTIIGNGVIIDNQIQIGHNVTIGDHSALAGAVAVAGSTSIGKYCQIGGASAIAGHIRIVDGTIITGMSMVTGSIKEKGVYSSGVPATETKRWRRNAVRFTQLDEMAKTVRELQKQIQIQDK